MADCPGNMRAMYNGREACLRCKLKPEFDGPAMRETQGHLKLCHGYSEVRNGRDLAIFRKKGKYSKNIRKVKEKKMRR